MTTIGCTSPPPNPAPMHDCRASRITLWLRFKTTRRPSPLPPPPPPTHLYHPVLQPRRDTQLSLRAQQQLRAPRHREVGLHTIEPQQAGQGWKVWGGSGRAGAGTGMSRVRTWGLEAGQ
jgi:hypothetical protein